MTSATPVRAGSRPSATTRFTMSRSEKMARVRLRAAPERADVAGHHLPRGFEHGLVGPDGLRSLSFMRS